MDKLEITSHQVRRARTRSLIQIGGLVEKAGLLETFGITLGPDLQKDPLMKNPISALFKGFLDLDAMVNSGDVHMTVWAQQGLEGFKVSKEYTNDYKLYKKVNGTL